MLAQELTLARTEVMRDADITEVNSMCRKSYETVHLLDRLTAVDDPLVTTARPSSRNLLTKLQSCKNRRTDIIPLHTVVDGTQ